MDKARIISGISIEFGLSKEQSENIVNNMFSSIIQCLKNDKNLKIQKFGKFKLIQQNDPAEFRVKFTPSKKLASRVNSNFDDLKKVSLKYDSGVFDALKDQDTTVTARSVIESEKEEEQITVAEVPRKLISDDLIKLHKEITNEDVSDNSKTNLWG